MVKMIGCDGNITEKKLGESRVHLRGVGQNHTSSSIMFIPVNLNRMSKFPVCPSASVRTKTALFPQ